MTALFLVLVQRSLSAGWMILAVCLIRALFRRIPKSMVCWLWLLVALRLLLIYSPKSSISLVPAPPELAAVVSAAPAAARIRTADILAAVWVGGMGLMLMYTVVSYVLLRRQVAASLPIRQDVFICDSIPSPFILGVVRPKIYLPSSMDGLQKKHALAHEYAHLKHQDQLWKPLAFLLLCAYWFQPLCWLGYVLFCRDMELAADEAVIRTMSLQEKKAYSTTLLMCSAKNGVLAGCPVAFSEQDIRNRIQAILRYRRPKGWVIGAAAAVTAIAVLCFMTERPNAAKATPVVIETEPAVTEAAPEALFEIPLQVSALYRAEETEEPTAEASTEAPTQAPAETAPPPAPTHAPTVAPTTEPTVDPHPTEPTAPAETGIAAPSDTCARHAFFTYPGVEGRGCTSNGWVRQFCPYCGETRRVEDPVNYPALGHDFHVTVHPPAPWKDGYTEYFCTRCHVVHFEDWIDWRTAFPEETEGTEQEVP